MMAHEHKPGDFSNDFAKFQKRAESDVSAERIPVLACSRAPISAVGGMCRYRFPRPGAAGAD